MNRQSRIHFLLLSLVFLGPIVLAAVVYYGPSSWAPRAVHGELIEPPRYLPAEIMGLLRTSASSPRRAWFLLYARTSPCANACLTHLVRLHQVLLGLAEDGSRVQPAMLLTDAVPPVPPSAGWVTVHLDAAAEKGIIDLLGERSIREGRVYVADPLGRLVMNYPPAAEQKGMLEDLERLLQLSPIQ
jgi:hypothetical protein